MDVECARSGFDARNNTRRMIARVIGVESDWTGQCRADTSRDRLRFQRGRLSRYFSAETHFYTARAARESPIVFTTIPSSINLSAIIAQTLDSSPTRLHFIVPRSIFKRRRLSRRVCSDSLRVYVCTYL